MSAVLETICKMNKITDYLASHSVQYNSASSGRYRYRCPLPNHKADKAPSFFVYEKGDRQDFYCYGCKTAGSIINLVAAYEQLSLRDAIRKLSAGLDINLDDILESLIREIVVKINNPLEETKEEAMLANSLFISVHMHDFLKKVDFDPKELEIAEKVFAMTDSLLAIHNLTELELLVEELPSRTKFRYDRYMNEKQKKEIEQAKGQRGFVDEIRAL